MNNLITRSQAIKNFLKARTHSDLADMYNLAMECQVNVAQDNGERIEGEFKGRGWNGWTDGLTTWKPFRIPRNANTEPEYIDTNMSYDLAQHAEGIGMTGWDWQARCSRWVAFDFDAITGHSDKHASKIPEAEMEKVRVSASEIDWVTVRRSTGGRGLHLYVLLEPISTQNHTEHAALARSILGKMSALTGFDFHAKVDTCGGNMWVWHRKMGDAFNATVSPGLAIIKPGNTLREDQVPPNWREHIKVVSGQRRKTLPKNIAESNISEQEEMFLELIGQRTRTPLDESHKRLVTYLLEDRKTNSSWDADNHLLITHTWHLKDAHTKLDFKGVFETDSKGTEAPNDCNCFAFPLRRGGWAIRRYSPGVQEHPSWTQDGKGWTRCFYNQDPDLGTVSRAAGGVERKDGGFVFSEASIVIEALRKLSVDVQIPIFANSRKAIVKEHNDGRIIVEIDRDSHDDGGKFPGWLAEKGDKWFRIYNAQASVPNESETGNYDDIIRHLVTEGGGDFGWVIKTGTSWTDEPLGHVKPTLKALGFNAKDVEVIIGNAVLRRWLLVNKPFDEEYPGDRMWNRNSVQLRFTPTQNAETLTYPTWLKILNHCGKGLDSSIEKNGWAKANGVKTGADYLKIWIASLFREPREPLPYLFFYGPQNSGKSIFHEGLELLLTCGYVRADAALSSTNNFNGELRNAVLCVVEETDLKFNKIANTRIKDWVTARHLPLHAKGETPVHVPNTTHWVQASNDMSACPVFPGDTRITVAYVGDLDAVNMIPKKHLLPMLEKEAPDFLAELLGLEIPPSNDRLNVPVIMTEDKELIQQANRTILEVFLEEQCHYVPGKVIKYSDLWDRFEIYLQASGKEAGYWTIRRMGQELPKKFVKGRLGNDPNWHIGNISWIPRPVNEPELSPLVVRPNGNTAILVGYANNTNYPK